MKELIKFEFQKIIGQKRIYLIAFLLLALFMVTSPPLIENETYYEPYEGEVTEEKTEMIESGRESINDSVIERTDEERIKNNVYQSYLNERIIAESVQERMQELENKVKTSANETEAVMELEMLENVTLDTFYYHEGPAQTIDFVNTFGLVMAGALILIGLFNVYSNEYSTGVDKYIFTAKRGRKQIVHAKLVASFLYTFLVVCGWLLFDVIYQLIRLGSSGWQSPLQYIWKYRSSPYDFTLAEYFGTEIGVHLIGALGFATLVLLVSAICLKPIISFLISGLIFGLPIVWTSILMQDPNWLTDVSFTNIMKVAELFLNFSVYDVAGLLILKPIFLVVLSIIFSFVLIYATYYYIKHREV